MHSPHLLVLAAFSAATLLNSTTARSQPEPTELDLVQHDLVQPAPDDPDSTDDTGDTVSADTATAIPTSSQSAPEAAVQPPPSSPSSTVVPSATVGDASTTAVSPALYRAPFAPAADAEATNTAAASQPAAPPPALPAKGFVIAVGSGQSLKLGGFVQADGRFLFGNQGTDTFAVRRARLDFRATLASYLSARLHPELAGSRLNLLDAYITLGLVPELQVQVGKMKSPIGLELLQSPRDMVFPERGLPSLLVPNRDVGAVVQGALFGEAVTYTGGVFNGIPDGAHGEEDENQPFDVAGRVFLQPFTSLKLASLNGLGIGVAGSWGEQEGALPSHRTAGRQTLFSYADGVTANGSRTRIAPQGYYYYGPVGVLAEWVRSEQWVSTVEDERVQVSSTAWQVVGSVVIGGRAGYKGATLEAGLDPEARSWGAVELAGRYGQWQTDDAVFARDLADPETAPLAAKSFGLSAAWWLFAGTRVLVAFDRTTFELSEPSNQREPESVLVTRLQTTL